MDNTNRRVQAVEGLEAFYDGQVERIEQAFERDAYRYGAEAVAPLYTSAMTAAWNLRCRRMEGVFAS